MWNHNLWKSCVLNRLELKRVHTKQIWKQMPSEKCVCHFQELWLRFKKKWPQFRSQLETVIILFLQYNIICFHEKLNVLTGLWFCKLVNVYLLYYCSQIHSKFHLHINLTMSCCAIIYMQSPLTVEKISCVDDQIRPEKGVHGFMQLINVSKIGEMRVFWLSCPFFVFPCK